MGHISLPVPVVNIALFKILATNLSKLLGIPTKKLEDIMKNDGLNEGPIIVGGIGGILFFLELFDLLNSLKRHFIVLIRLLFTYLSILSSNLLFN